MNVFELYEGENDYERKQRIIAEKKIKMLVKIFAKKLKSIERKHNVGIGDTTTDEAIVEYVYEEIHR